MSHQYRHRTNALMIAAIIVAAFFLTRHCAGDPESVQVDTLYVKGTPDTIIIHDTAIKYTYRPAPLDSVHNYVHNGVDTCDDLRVYLDSLVDSSGTVYVRDSVCGTLLSQVISANFSHKIVRQTDTLTIRQTVSNGYGLKIYAGVNVNNDNALSPYLYLSQNRVAVQIGYDLKNKVPVFGIGYRLK